MARQKSRKTALKRLRTTNPKGDRRAKIMYKQSGQHHLKTKLSRKTKRRKKSSTVVSTAIGKRYRKILK